MHKGWPSTFHHRHKPSTLTLTGLLFSSLVPGSFDIKRERSSPCTDSTLSVNGELQVSCIFVVHQAQVSPVHELYSQIHKMVKEIKGPWGIILIGPAASNTPYKAWDRNQGTYLAIAAAAPLFLTLFATISLPIIPGVYTAKMTVGDKVGEAMFGLWGTCLKGQDINDTIV